MVLTDRNSWWFWFTVKISLSTIKFLSVYCKKIQCRKLKIRSEAVFGISQIWLNSVSHANKASPFHKTNLRKITYYSSCETPFRKIAKIFHQNFCNLCESCSVISYMLDCFQENVSNHIHIFKIENKNY